MSTGGQILSMNQAHASFFKESCKFKPWIRFAGFSVDGKASRDYNKKQYISDSFFANKDRRNHGFFTPCLGGD